MNQNEARRQAEQLLKDSPAGTQISLQTQGQIEHPHGDDDHVDSWVATKQADGTVKVEKEHT